MTPPPSKSGFDPNATIAFVDYRAIQKRIRECRDRGERLRVGCNCGIVHACKRGKGRRKPGEVNGDDCRECIAEQDAQLGSEIA